MSSKGVEYSMSSPLSPSVCKTTPYILSLISIPFASLLPPLSTSLCSLFLSSEPLSIVTFMLAFYNNIVFLTLFLSQQNFYFFLHLGSTFHEESKLIKSNHTRMLVSARQSMSLWGVCSSKLSRKKLNAVRFSLNHTK